MPQIKTILVTGGAGFVGSHLCETLATNSNHKVYSLDNYFTGSKDNHVPGVTYIEGATADIDKLIDFTPDTIYHLGEYSRVEQSFEDIEKVWQYNKDGIFAVLQFCRKTGAKIIYAGSSTKFGDGGLSRNQSPYGWTKASNTELVVNYGNWFSLSYAITYFYNVYGPGEIATGKYATLIGIYSECIKKNQPLPVVLPGTQRRNFTHVTDIISGLMMVAERGYGDEFGIGNEESYSILEVAEMLDSPIKFISERRGNRMSAEVLTDKTKALGWRAERALIDYLKSIRI